jgi:hypothetical protein
MINTLTNTEPKTIPILNMSTDEADKLIKLNSELEKRMQEGEFDKIDLEYACRVARTVSNSKITSRWWERLLAYHLSWETDPTSTDGKDYGDLFATGKILGIDNIELKTSEKEGSGHIGGQQMRFYEDIPWYMFVKLNPYDNNGFRIFMLHKNDIHDEIFKHKSMLPGVSQGSGKTKNKTDDQRRLMIQETFDKKNDILWGFGVNMSSKGQKEAWDRWQSKYETTIDELKNWNAFKEKNLGI